MHEAASGSVFVQMPDVWVNLAHVYFAQGHFGLAVKMASPSPAFLFLNPTFFFVSNSFPKLLVFMITFCHFTVPKLLEEVLL